MNPELTRLALVARRHVKTVSGAVVGPIVVALMRLARLAKRERMANVCGAFMRRAGPWLPEHRTGRANLKAAFPDKSPQEIEAILAGVWDNLGRVAAEFPHLHRMRLLDIKRPGPADVIVDAVTDKHFHDMRDGGRATLLFASHLANWEVPALIAAHFGLDTYVLYRPPNLRAAAGAVVKIRAGLMGTLVPSGFDAPIRLANALERGSHVGMLVDQYDVKGVDVTFFGRTCKVSPLLAQLARHLDCPIRGARTVRLAGGNQLRAELTAPIEPARDAQGRIDIQGTMQAVTSVVEGWVREHPEQWLWLHRRWR